MKKKEGSIWSVFNTVLLRFPQAQRVWVENFAEVSAVLKNTKRDKVIAAFNQDSFSWVLQADTDGVLFAERKK